MSKTIFTVFALCFLSTLSYAEPPAGNHKLKKPMVSENSVQPTAVASRKVADVSDITLPAVMFRKNQAYLSRKTRRPVHVIPVSSNPGSTNPGAATYDYKDRNHKLKNPVKVREQRP